MSARRKKTYHPSEEFGRTAIYSRTGKSGKAVYYVRYAWKGKTYGERAGLNLRAAERLLTLRHGQMAEDPHFVPPPEKRRRHRSEQGPPFRAFYETRFLPDYAAGRRSAYYENVGKELCDWFGDKPLGRITAADVDKFRHAKPADFPAPPPGYKGRDPRTRRPPGPSTIRRRLAVLQLVFKIAERWGVCRGNPVVGVDRPKEPDHKTNFLTRDEFAALHAEAPPWLRPILVLAVNTALRRKEVVGLRWDDVDFPGKQLYVSSDSKTGQGRYVPANATALTVLRSQRERVREIQRETDPGRIIPWVFVDAEGNDYTGEDARAVVSNATKAAAKRAGIGRKITFHDLRHTSASWMVQAGRPLYEVQNVLGHADPSTTMRYAHLTPERLREAVLTLDLSSEASSL